MTLESGPRSNLPVPLNLIPAEDRLVIRIFELDQLAKRIASRKQVMEHNRTAIKEAAKYIPPFTQEIAISLHQTKELLVEAGLTPDVSKVQEQKRAIEEEVDRILGLYVGLFAEKVDRYNISTSIFRDLAKRLHPDIKGPNRPNIPSREIAQTLSKAKKAAEKKDSDAAEDVLLESMPDYLLRHILAEGYCCRQRTQFGWY